MSDPIPRLKEVFRDVFDDDDLFIDRDTKGGRREALALLRDRLRRGSRERCIHR